MNSWAAFFLGAWVGATLSPLLLGILVLQATREKGDTE